MRQRLAFRIDFCRERTLICNFVDFSDITMGSALPLATDGQTDPPVSVSQLWIYPLKSARGIRVDSAKLGPLGFEHDRVFMLVEELPSKSDPKRTQWHVMTLRKWQRVYVR